MNRITSNYISLNIKLKKIVLNDLSFKYWKYKTKFNSYAFICNSYDFFNTLILNNLKSKKIYKIKNIFFEISCFLYTILV